MRPCKRAVEYCRAGKGPAFVHGHVIRPYSHSLSDDEKLYRPEAERQEDAQRDPITRMQMFLVREGILDEEEINQLEEDVDEEVADAADRALVPRLPTPDSMYNVTSTRADLDPTSSAVSNRRAPQHRQAAAPRPWPTSSTPA